MKQNKLGEGVPNIVVPTIRSEEVFTTFMDNWKEEFKGCHLIVVEDRQKKILQPLLKSYTGFTYEIFDWKDIDKDLKKKAWIIPRQTDCVRSYGYYKAWQNKPLFIVTLDDDVSPGKNHIQTFYTKLFTEQYPNHLFFNTMKHPLLPRGTYIDSTGCDVVHGCWANVPDFSAVESAKNPNLKVRDVDFNMGLIPKGALASICGMNLAWKPHITPFMYFGLQGGQYPIDRCGDIWCGYRLCRNNIKIYSGEPICYHTKASNVWANMKKEKNACTLSWDIIDGEAMYSQLEYEQKLKEAENIWESLFI